MYIDEVMNIPRLQVQVQGRTYTFSKSDLITILDAIMTIHA